MKSIRLKIILAVIGAAWGLLAILAQKPELRQQMTDLNQRLAAGLDDAQLGENTIDAFRELTKVRFDEHGNLVKPPPAYVLPLMSVWNAAGKVWAGGWIAVVIAVAALLLTLGIWYNSTEQSWAGFFIGVPLGTAAIAWFLKLALIGVLAGASVVVSLAAYFAFAIVAIEYMRKTANEFLKYGEVAEKMTRRTPSTPSKT